MKYPKFIVGLLAALIVISIAFLYMTKRFNDAPKIKLTLPSKTSYAAYSPNGHLLATINGNNLDIWDADTGDKLRQIQTQATMIKAIFSKQGEHLVTISTENNLALIWDTSIWSMVSEIKASGKIFNAIYTADGQYLYTVASNYSDDKNSFNVIEKWDANSGKKVHEDRWDINHTVAFLPLGLSFNDKLLAVADNTSDNEGVIRIWSVSDGSIVASFSLPTAILSLAWSPNAETLIFGSRDNTLHVWDINTRKEIQKINRLNGSIYGVTYSQDGCYIIGGGNHQSTLVWNAKTGQQIVDLKDITSSGMILNIANNPNNNSVAISKAERDSQSTDIWDFSGLLGNKTC